MNTIAKTKSITRNAKVKTAIEKISKSINKSMTQKYLKKMLNDCNN